MDQSQLINLAVFGALFGAFILFKRAGQIAPDEARRLIAEGARLVDVRSPGEFASGHLPGAVNVPVDALRERVGELGEREAPVILYCASGMRSAVARSTLKGLGFSKVYNLGSMSRW